ncbi:MAG: hypothetical protein H8D72_01685 [Planctomycetes bacterium]|nr:hypothetical protein [Planctomycetota bacterium]
MRRALPFLGFALLLIVTRLFVATVSSEPFERGEEYVRGSAALALTGGLLDGINAELEALDEAPVGYEALFYHAYEGGGFVHALLTVPAFALFGPSLLAHKVVAIGFELFVLLAGFLLAREVFGARAGIPFCLLWIFSPLAFQEIAPLNLGIHYQALLFQFGVAALGLGVLRGAPRPFALGVLGGFGLFYNYQLAPLIGLLALAFLLGRCLDAKGWGRLIAGFAVGGLPLWYMLAATGSAMFDIHGQQLGDEGVQSASLVEVLRNFGRALGPRGALQATGLTALAVFAARRGPRAARLLFGYVLLFALLIPFTGFLSANFDYSFGAMRYAPLFGFTTVLAAGAVSLLPLRAAGPSLSVLVLAGLSSTLATANTGDGPAAGFERIASTRGTDFGDYFSKLQRRFPERLSADPSAAMRALAHVGGAPRLEVLTAATRAITHKQKEPLEVLVPQLQAAFPGEWQLALGGLGAWAMRGSRGELFVGQRKLRQQLLKLPREARRDVPADELVDSALEGLGRFGTGAFPTTENLRGELDQMRDRAIRGSVYLGHGARLYHALCLAPSRLETLLEGRNPELQERIRTGFERERLARELGR